MKNPKIEKKKWDTLNNFQTMWTENCTIKIVWYGKQISMLCMILV